MSIAIVFMLLDFNYFSAKMHSLTPKNSIYLRICIILKISTWSWHQE